MSDIDTMMAAVLADPADDHPRLVYADALGDRDGPGDADRAEFIRAQIEIARLDRDQPGWRNRPGPSGTLGRALLRRDWELWHHTGVCRSLAVPPTLTPCLTGELYPAACAVVRRGFVDEVRLPLAMLMGTQGRCDTCNYDPDGVDTIGCPACSGTGRAEGVAAALFAAHPVTRVVLTNREPQGDDLRGWVWMTGNSRQRNDEIPHALTRHFQRRRSGYTRFPTAAAHAALSAACVAYGRAKAGLPPVTPAGRT